MKAQTLHITKPSKELLEFARDLRAKKQEKIMKYRSKKNFNFKIKACNIGSRDSFHK